MILLPVQVTVPAAVETGCVSHSTSNIDSGTSPCHLAAIPSMPTWFFAVTVMVTGSQTAAAVGDMDMSMRSGPVI